MKYIIRPLNLEDLSLIDDIILDINKEEAMVITGKPVSSWLSKPNQFDNSEVLVVDDKIVAVGGHRDTDEGCIVWVMATKYLYDHPITFFSTMKKNFDKLKKEKDYIFAYVYGKNIITQDWLKKLGFEVHQKIKVVLNSEDFYLFDWARFSTEDIMTVRNNEIVRSPTKEDIEFLVANIRDEDLKEFTAIGGKDLYDCLSNTIDLIKNSWVWEHDGVVMSIGGVNPCKEWDGAGVIWMLATKFFDEKQKSFRFICKDLVKNTIKDYDYVFNVVHADNIKSIRWLKWLGFNVHDAKPIGIDGSMFHFFDMRGKNV